MEKVALGMVAVLLAAGTADAFVKVEVNSTGGYVEKDMAADWDNTLDIGSMFYVAWSADNTIDPTALGSYLPSGDDKIAKLEGGGDAIFYTGAQGGSWGDYGKIEQFDPLSIYAPDSVSDNDFHNGQLYLRVFNASNPVVGSDYVSGSLNGVGGTNVWGDAWDVDGDDQLTPEDPENPISTGSYEQLDMTASTDGQGTGPFVILDSTIQAIPEPGTLGLLALGLAGVFAARKKNRK